MRLAGTLVFPDGVLAQIDCGFDLAPRSGLEVTGTEGILRVAYPWTCQEVGIELRRGDDVQWIEVENPDRYRLQGDNVSRAIRGLEEPLLGRADALAQARAIAALYRSAEQGGRRGPRSSRVTAVNPTFLLGGELEVRRLGFGAMRVVGDPEEGKIRLIGLSNVSVGQLRQAQSAARVVSVQNEYNRGFVVSEDVLAACEAEGIGFFPWQPLGEGPGEPAEELRRLLDRSPVLLPIPGTSKVEHLEANMRAVA